MIKPEQINTLDNDSIIEQLYLILNKIEELDLRMKVEPDKSSKSRQAAWLAAIDKHKGVALTTPFLYLLNP